MNPVCSYCGQFAELVTGKELYPHRPELASKKGWRCAPCEAWVGCHPGTTVPLGRLANAELRAAKQRVHAIFDSFWKHRRPRNRARVQCYQRLTKDLGIPASECHIGMFDVDRCNKAIEVIEKWS